MTESQYDGSGSGLQSEVAFRGLYNSMLEGVAFHEIIYDDSGKPVDYLILDVNPSYEKITGIQRNNVMGKKASEIYGTGAPPYIDVYSQVASSGKPITFEVFFAPMGKHFTISVFSLSKGRFTTVFHDITNYKKAEERISNLASFPEMNPNPVLEVDFSGRVSYENPASKLMFQDISSKGVYHPLLSEWREIVEILKMEGNGRLEREVKIGDRWFLQNSYLVPNDKIRIYALDITTRKIEEEKMRQLNFTLRAIGNSNQALLHVSDERSYLQEVCNIIIHDCGYAMTWVGFAENDESKSVRPIAHAGFDQSYIENLNITWSDTERGRGPTGTAIRTGKVSVCRNMLTDPCFLPWRESAIKHGYASSIVLPLNIGSRVIGALNIYSKEADHFADEEVELLIELARDFSQGIAMFRLRESERVAKKLLKESNDKLSTILGSIADGFYALDRQWRFIHVNEAALKYFGMTPGEMIGRSIFEVFPYMRGTAIEREFLSAMETGNPVHLETHSLIYDKTNEIHIYPSQDSMTVIFRDVTERKKMQEEIKNSEEKYRLLLQYAPTAIYEIDYKGPKFRSVNDAMCQMSGYSREELMSMNPLDMLVKESRDLFQERIRKVLAGENVEENVEYKTINKDGKEMCVVLNIKLTYRDGKLDGALVVGHDVTQRKKSEEALLRSKEEWERTFDSVPDLIAILDSQHRIVRVNKAMANKLNSDPQSCIGLNCFRCVHGLSQPPDFCPHSLTLKDHKEHVAEVHEDNLGGDFLVSTTPLFDENSQIVGSVHVARNITEKKRAEDALRSSVEELKNKNNLVEDLAMDIKEESELNRIIMESTKTLLAYLDNDFNIVKVNDAYAEGYGKSKEELIGKNYFDLFPSDEIKMLFEKSKGTGQTLEFNDKPFVFKGRPDLGTTYWNWTLTPLKDDKNKVNGLVLSMIDITSIKKSEETLKKSLVEKEILLKEVHHSEEILRKSLVEKEILLKEVHHRVKNNLQMISSLLHLQAMFSDQNTSQLLKESQNRIRSMSLVHEILYETKDFTKINVKYYIEELLKRLVGASTKSITFQSEIENVSINMDNVILMGIIINELVTNSIKYAFPDRTGKIKVSLRSSGKEVELTVEDDGKGMPNEFDWKNSKSLGLKLVNSITNQMNGRIVTETGNGTKFKIIIPNK